MKTVKIGMLGVGNISGIYLQNITGLYREIEVWGICDLIPEKMAAAKEQYPHVKCYDCMEEMFADPEIDIVLNITRPYEHYDTTKAALLAGKHVYSEKPLAATFEQGKELVELAESKGLMLGGAPDTFLGAGIQTCRRLIDDGYIGRPVGAAARLMCHGHETWHPAPAFYYQFGGGPMLDMGPYYLTALINLLGGVKELTGMAIKGNETRTITSAPLYGQEVKVEVPTHINGILRFDSGAVATITTSFDTYYDNSAVLEVYGTEGTLKVPDPNGFGGPVYLFRPEDGEFKEMPLTCNYRDNSRGLGLADMAKALQTGRRARADYTQTLHVLEIMTSLEKNSKEFIELTTRYERADGMKNVRLEGILD